MVDTIAISHIPTKTETYIGSPSIAQLPSKELIVSHDYFGPGSSAAQSGVTEIYGSFDGGESWQHRTTLHNTFWSSLFVHSEKLYLIGTNREHGELIIRESLNGIEWTDPIIIADGKWHTAPVPVVVWEGRIWRGVEDAEGGTNWPSRYRARYISAAIDADLLSRASWIVSEPYSSQELHNQGVVGWLEGNVLIDTQNKPGLLLRIESPSANSAIFLPINQARHNFSTPRFVSLPGGTKKFSVRYDEKSKRYVSLTNPVLTEMPDINPSHIRNRLTLVSSTNLENWIIHTELLTSEDVTHHGFQYADWIIDEDDLIAVVRAAAPYGDEIPHNYHDANQLLFFRLKDFRKLLA